MEWNDLGIKDTQDVRVRVASNYTGEFTDVVVRNLDVYDIDNIYFDSGVISAVSGIVALDKEWLIESNQLYLTTEDFYEEPRVTIEENL